MPELAEIISAQDKGKLIRQMSLTESIARDETLRSSPEGPVEVTSQFTKWILASEDLSFRAGNGEYSLPLPKKNKEPDYFHRDKKWGEWPEDREDLRNSKNLAYLFSEVGLDVAFHSDICFKNDDGTNLSQAVLSVISVEAYREVLRFVNEHKDPKNISKTIATRMLGIYINRLLDLAQKNKDNLEVISQFAFEVCKQIVSKIDERECFSRESHPESRVFLEAQKRLKTVSPDTNEGLVKKEIDGWLFYVASDDWPEEPVARTVSSHCPNFPIEDYFDGSNRYGGVLLTGTPIKMFYHDIASSREELAMGKDWSAAKFVKLHPDIVCEQARHNGVSQKVQGNNILGYSKYECFSLEEAWNRRWEEPGIRTYTEVWLDEPFAYAIWVDSKWNETVSYFNTNSLLRLISSRPDLPVIDSAGNLVNRMELMRKISSIIPVGS